MWEIIMSHYQLHREGIQKKMAERLRLEQKGRRIYGMESASTKDSLGNEVSSG